MPGRQARILTPEQADDLLFWALQSRYPLRNRIVALLSIKAGLRAAEIAKLTWDMVLDAEGSIGTSIALHDRIAKKRGGRIIPMNADLRRSLIIFRLVSSAERNSAVVQSERGGPMTPLSIVIWFGRAFQAIGLVGCSSHSGRRTFITKAAKMVYAAGGSLRDVQLLAGHRSILTTQRYIEGDSEAQRRLVHLID